MNEKYNFSEKLLQKKKVSILNILLTKMYGRKTMRAVTVMDAMNKCNNKAYYNVLKIEKCLESLSSVSYA